MPPRFKFPQEAQLWIPIAGLAQADLRAWRNYQVFARRKPNVTQEQATNELDAVSRRVNEANGLAREGWIGYARPIRDDLIPDDVKLVVLSMMGGMLVLLVAAPTGQSDVFLGSSRQR